MPLKILIADDHILFRQGLVALVSETPGLVVAALASGGEEAVRLAAALRPKVAILDVGMPNLDGIEATRRIAARAPETRVVALSMFADAGHVAAMLKAGAAGYVLKDEAFEDLTAAIHTVADGGRWLSPRLPDLGTAAHSALSEREREVIRLLADGAGYKEIAKRLGVGLKTVETYRQRAAHKLGVRSGPELVSRAIREGLLEPLE